MLHQRPTAQGGGSRAISTVVAHFLHTEGVTGSNPVSPITPSTKLSKADRMSLQKGVEVFSCLALFPTRLLIRRAAVPLAILRMAETDAP